MPRRASCFGRVAWRTRGARGVLRLVVVAATAEVQVRVDAGDQRLVMHRCSQHPHHAHTPAPLGVISMHAASSIMRAAAVGVVR